MESAARNRLVRAAGWAAVLTPIAILLADAAGHRLGANPIATVLNRLGFWTLTFLALSLAPTPLQRWAGLTWPLRLVVPWKYGFKGVKSIVRITLTERQPPTSWNRLAPNEYGFYGNVDPTVDHPRWSQARERRIGEFQKRKTLPFNGYGDEVASLYAGLDPRTLY